MGHNHVGHNYMGQNYMGHNYSIGQQAAAQTVIYMTAPAAGVKMLKGAFNDGKVAKVQDSYGLYSHGPSSYGLYSYGHIVMAYIVMVAGVKMREGAFNNGAEGPNSVNMTLLFSSIFTDRRFVLSLVKL